MRLDRSVLGFASVAAFMTVCLGGLVGAANAAARAPNAGDEGPGFVGLPEYPALSADGATVVFSWAGDLWSVGSGGGACTRLTAHPANESRAAVSPDGSMLAFESDRDGARNLYVAPIGRSGGAGGAGGFIAGAVQRVTVSERPQFLAGWTLDGKALLFHASQEPAMYRSPRMYRVDVDLDGRARPMGVVGGPESLLTPAFGLWPRMAGDGSLVFQRGSAPWERPVYRGPGTSDVWRMGADGAFTRLSDAPANEMEPWPLPDGSAVVISSRDGQNNVWRLGPGNAATQLTKFAPTADQITIGHGVRDLCVSGDGSTAVFAVWDRLYRLDLRSPGDEPRPIPLAAGADYASLEVQRLNVDKDVSEAVLSPDGKTLAVVARGDVFVRNVTEGHPARRVTATDGRERDLAWSPDGRVLYFSSDRVDGDNLARYQIYGATVALSRQDLVPAKKDTAEKDASADKKDDKKEEKKDEADKPAENSEDKPKEAAAGADTKADEKPKKDSKPDHGKRWSEALRFTVEPVVIGEAEVRSPVPSPDGRLLAYTRALGDLVVRNLESGQERVMLTGWNPPEVVWAPDSRHMLYAVEDLDFNADIWLADTGGAEPPEDFKPTPPVNLTQHPDNDESPRLSADGKVLTFLSERGTSNDQVDVYQVFLDRSLEGMSGYERDEYFKTAAEAAGKRKPSPTPEFVTQALKPGAPEPKADAEANADAKKEGEPAKEKAKPKKPEPLKFDAEDAYLRIRRITATPGSKSDLAVTPGADRVIFSAPGDGDPALVSIDHKGKDLKTLQSGAVSRVAVTLTGDKVSYIRQGAVSTISPKGAAKSDPLPIDAQIVVDIPRQQRQKFMEAARTFGDRFYHPTMKGLDWTALTRRYLPLAAQTRTSEAFNRVTQMLFGQTDGSHTGIFGGASANNSPAPGVGFLGVKAEPAPGGFRVKVVLPDSPATTATPALQAGDVITAIDGQRLASGADAAPDVDLDAALAGRAGRETLVEFRRAGTPDANAADKPAEAVPVDPASGERVTLVTPLAWPAWDALHYRFEVQQRRDAVEKAGNGRLGYLHIRGMGEAEVRVFERDLYAAARGKEGLIVDVRDNGGGFTADILLSSLTAPRHAYTVPRGADPGTVPPDAYPRDRRLIYAWTRPMNVLINQNSFSNAEIFAHAIKSIGRGRLIGTATFGGVISTGAFTLIDGTVVRMPFRGWYLPGGHDMENNGARPDVDVPQLPADEVAGRDAQLEAAVKDLLNTLDRASANR